MNVDDADTPRRQRMPRQERHAAAAQTVAKIIYLPLLRAIRVDADDADYAAFAPMLRQGQRLPLRRYCFRRFTLMNST